MRDLVAHAFQVERNRQAILMVSMTGTKDSVGSKPIGRPISFAGLIPPPSTFERSPAQVQEERESMRQATTVLLDELESSCREMASPVKYSPLFEALRSHVQDMRESCKDSDPCHVLFYTDLQEIAEPWICTEIFGADWYGKPDGCPANRGRTEPEHSRDGAIIWSDGAIPKPIDASGIEITVCGLAGSTDSQAAKITPEAQRRTREVWKRLFPNAARFEILDHCSSIH